MGGPVAAPMPVRWLVDEEATAVLWRDLSEMPLRLLDGPGWVGDFGGGNGNFVSPLLHTGAGLVSVDLDHASLRAADGRIRTAAGSLLTLPFRAGAFDAAAGRAILHHMPDALDAALAEAERVVKPGGLVLFEEPTAGNVLATAARTWFPTERHDPHERPLSVDAYVAAISRHFAVLEVRPYFLLSYLLPHVAGRVPPGRRGLLRVIARALFAWDQRLLAALPRLRRHAAYVAILARRGRDSA